MKLTKLILFLILCSTNVAAKDRGVSLSEAVNQAKSQGKVLSARTINGQHEVKVLKPNGSVKTIHKRANNSIKFSNNDPYYQRGNQAANQNSNHRSGQTLHDKYKNQPLPSRQKNQSRNVMRLKDRNSRSGQSGNYNNRTQGNRSHNNTSRNVQRIPNRSNRTSTRNKDSDN